MPDNRSSRGKKSCAAPVAPDTPKIICRVKVEVLEGRAVNITSTCEDDAVTMNILAMAAQLYAQKIEQEAVCTGSIAAT